jgi:hypothetical protein
MLILGHRQTWRPQRHSILFYKELAEIPGIALDSAHFRFLGAILKADNSGLPSHLGRPPLLALRTDPKENTTSLLVTGPCLTTASPGIDPKENTTSA